MEINWKKTKDELPTYNLHILLCDKHGVMSVGTKDHLEWRTHVEEPVFPAWAYLPDKPDWMV